MDSCEGKRNVQLYTSQQSIKKSILSVLKTLDEWKECSTLLKDSAMNYSNYINKYSHIDTVNINHYYQNLMSDDVNYHIS